MRKQLTIALLATAIAAPAFAGGDKDPRRGLSAVNVPVVTRTDYVFDAMGSGAGLPSSEMARLDAFFAGLNLSYGDRIYVSSSASPSARGDVAQIAGRYGMLLTAGSPVVEGVMPAGTVRVIVSRATAMMPTCPNWSERAQPNYRNHQLSNLGCAVNGNMAAMVADPQDFVWGREGNGVGDADTAARAIRSLRSLPPSGEKGLTDVSTKDSN